MPIQITCADCGATFQAKDDLAGKRVRCRSCSGVISVPAAEAPRPPASRPVAAPKPAASRPAASAPKPAIASPKPAAAKPSPARPAPDLTRLDPSLLAPPDLSTPPLNPAMMQGAGAYQANWSNPNTYASERPRRRPHGPVNWEAAGMSCGLCAATFVLGVLLAVGLRFFPLGPEYADFVMAASIALVIAMVLGGIISVAGWLWVVILSLRDDELLQTLLIPGYALYYGFRTWKRSHVAVRMYCGGLLPLMLFMGMLTVSVVISASKFRPRLSIPVARARTEKPRTETPKPAAAPKPPPPTFTPPTFTPPIRPPALGAAPMGLANIDFPLAEGYTLRVPLGLRFSIQAAGLGTSRDRRYEWSGRPGPGGFEPQLSVTIRKGSQYAATPEPAHTTGTQTPNIDGVLIDVNGVYELRDSQVTRETIGDIPFLRAQRSRDTPQGTQQIVAYLSHHEDRLIEIVLLDDSDKRWLGTMEEAARTFKVKGR